MRRLRALSALVLAAVLAAACGARLEDEQRLAVVEGVAADQQVVAEPGDAGAEPASQQGAETPPGGDDGTPAQPGSAPPGQAPAPEAGQPAASGVDTGGVQEDPAPGQTPQPAQQPASQPASTDTRAAPAGGNGGATDVGVTEDRIVVANVSDLSGPVPGLFEEAQIATKAALAHFEATEGTIYGRRLALKPYDARMSAGGNREAYLDACEAAFMAVGSWSAFDQGVTPVIDDCQIPDFRTVALTPGLQGLENQVSGDTMKPYHQPISAYIWVKDNFPDVIEHAAYLYIAGEVTEYNTGMERNATRTIGFEWIYEQTIEVSESNYAPFVNEMKKRGVRHVSFQGAYQQGVKLAEAMRQQNYWPDVVMFQANVYHQDFLTLGGADVEKVIVPIVSHPLEEIQAVPEAQVYAEWYQRVAPGKRPTAMGMYSWAMTKLVIEKLKEIGPQVTRPKILEAVRSVQGYTGNGLLPPQDYVSKTPNDCNLFTQVRDGRFVRIFPQQGYFCEGGAIDTSQL